MECETFVSTGWDSCDPESQLLENPSLECTNNCLRCCCTCPILLSLLEIMKSCEWLKLTKQLSVEFRSLLPITMLAALMNWHTFPCVSRFPRFEQMQGTVWEDSFPARPQIGGVGSQKLVDFFLSQWIPSKLFRVSLKNWSRRCTACSVHSLVGIFTELVDGRNHRGTLVGLTRDTNINIF